MKPTTTTSSNSLDHHHHQVESSMVIDAPIDKAWERLQAFKRSTLPLKEIQEQNNNVFNGSNVDTSYRNGVLRQVCITSNEGGEMKLQTKDEESSCQTLLEWTTSVSSTGSEQEVDVMDDQEQQNNKLNFFAAFQKYLTHHVDLGDEIWMHIASFASPPDVYNLCLTSKRFHRPASSKSVNATTTNDEGDSAAVAPPPVLICTKLLRASLLSSLDHVLRNSKAAGLSLDKANKMFLHYTVSRNSVIISGSTMVQCVLGESWKTDVDIFCTNSAAPAVRSWLIKEANQLCRGFCDYYVGVDNLGGVFNNKILQVEHYCNRPKDGTPHECSWKDDFNFETACSYGRQINQSYFPRPWQRLFHNGNVRDLDGRNYRIHSLPGDPFAFNYDFGDDCYSKALTAFDLVVAMNNCSSVHDILGDFDMNICKATWNGATFSIPDPHYTFTRRSRMEPKRNAWMKSYQRHYHKEYHDRGCFHLESGAAERFWRIRIAMEEVRREHGHDVLVSPYNDGAAGADDDDDDDIPLRKELEAMTFHNFFYKLFERLKKYKDRGIHVEDAPEISDFRIFGYDISRFSNAVFEHVVLEPDAF